MTVEEQRDVLRRAKEVLLERGWRNDGRYGPDCGQGPVCIVGALGVADSGNAYALYADVHPVFTPLALALPMWFQIEHAGFCDGASIVGFNDEYASFEDVIALLDKALASLEPSETPELVA